VGVVSRIRPIGEDNRGDTVYKVVVKPTRNDDRLLWNMTAVVEFPVQVRMRCEGRIARGAADRCSMRSG
jgi:hypothetical protein